MKIYIVRKGMYDDQVLLAAYSSAEIAMNAYPDNWSYHTWPLNPEYDRWINDSRDEVDYRDIVEMDLDPPRQV